MSLQTVVDKQVLALAEAHLGGALKLMRAHSIAVTPENIMVWYHHKQGDMQQLSRELSRLLACNTSFTPNLCQQLHQRFFSEIDRRKLDLLREAIRQLIAHLMGHLEVLTTDVGGYESALEGCIQVLEKDPDVEQLKSLVETLLAESRQALDVSADAQAKMNKLHAEISHLRNSLQDLERSALEDPLTGVANRRAFDQKFTEQLESVKETGRRSCLLLVDIDYFKGFNDTYGHLAGDKALRYVAMILRDQIKGQDFLARYGGEEFAIILPNTEYGGGLALARVIANRLASTPLTLSEVGEAIDPITVSVGVSSTRHGDTRETLFRRADAGLYKAKELGRNTVVGEQDL